MRIQRFYDTFSGHFRGDRMTDLVERTGLTEDTSVLDVGGTLYNWNLLPFRPRLTILNSFTAPPNLPDDVRWIAGDGCRLPFGDDSFDLCFSNSVIEHVGDVQRQQSFASEIRRVARHYYVQTPDYAFPLEPHLLTPFIHWLPLAWRRRLTPRATVWGLLERPSRAESDRFVDETHLLRASQMQACFPDGSLRRERVLGLSKSLIAFR
jgi:hypothetical protein